MISTESIQSGIKRLAQAMEQAADELNTSDGLLGDGDLGVTMIRGFRHILADLETLPEDIGMAFFQCAKAFTNSSGSSYGTLLATGMMAIAKVKKGQTGIELEEVSGLFDISLEAMQKRGKASLGDKTVLDVLAAVRDASKNQADGHVVTVSTKPSMIPWINSGITRVKLDEQGFLGKNPSDSMTQGCWLSNECLNL